jgi:Ca2+-binding EF-hand superfamily protein
MPATVTSRAFKRIDPKDSTLTKDDLKGWLKGIGVGSGLLGPKIRSTAADEFVDKFSTDGNDTITFAEFQEGLPAVVADLMNGVVPPEKVDQVFDVYDRNDTDTITMDEVKAEVLKVLIERGVDNAEIRADIAGRVAVDILSADRKVITRADFRQAMAELFPPAAA